MVSFEGFQLVEGVPIYAQIILTIKRGAVAGTVRDGDELPSRRVLSALLGVNPNTIQKAYRMLEEEGLIQSHSGAKSYMVLNPERIAQIRRDLMTRDARTVIDSMRQMGVSREELLALIETLWK